MLDSGHTKVKKTGVVHPRKTYKHEDRNALMEMDSGARGTQEALNPDIQQGVVTSLPEGGNV